MQTVKRSRLQSLILRDCCDGRRFRRQFSDLPQNRKENQVPRIAAIVPALAAGRAF